MNAVHTELTPDSDGIGRTYSRSTLSGKLLSWASQCSNAGRWGRLAKLQRSNTDWRKGLNCVDQLGRDMVVKFNNELRKIVMSSKVGASVLAAVVFLAVGASAADTSGPLSDGKAAGLKDAMSYRGVNYAPYLLLASLGTFAGLAVSQGDGAIGGCVGLDGCTAPPVTTTTTTPPVTTTTTPTTTTTRTTSTTTSTTSSH